MEALKSIAFLRTSWPLFLVSLWIVCLSFFGPSMWQVWVLMLGVGFQLLLVVTHFRYPEQELTGLGSFLSRASILFVIGVLAIFCWKTYVVNPRHTNFMKEVNESGAKRPNQN